MTTSCTPVFMVSLTHSDLQGFITCSTQMPSLGQRLWSGEEMSPAGLPALRAPLPETQLQGPAHPPGVRILSTRPKANLRAGFGISTSLYLGRMKTITSTSLETSLELELCSLFLPSGFNTVEKVRGEGGWVKPTTPRAAGVRQPLRTGSE